eukprot:scaffold12673_cov124-Isochrysis_galbana.AAC.2
MDWRRRWGGEHRCESVSYWESVARRASGALHGAASANGAGLRDRTAALDLTFLLLRGLMPTTDNGGTLRREHGALCEIGRPCFVYEGELDGPCRGPEPLH